MDDKIIAWEFRENDMHFEGFETYRIQSDGSYRVNAEFITSDQLRTRIRGQVCKQNKVAPEQRENEEEDVE